MDETVAGNEQDVPASSESSAEKEWTYRGWYEKNKEALSQRRKSKYQSDDSYREKVLEKNRGYRARKSKEKKAAFGNVARVPKSRRPVAVKVDVNGAVQDVTMVHIGAFAKAIGRSVPTIHQWERVGLLPRTPFSLKGKSKHERLYSSAMIEVVKSALRTRGAMVYASDKSFHDEIVSGWKAIGVVAEEQS